MMNINNNSKAYLLTLLAVLFWSTVATAFKISLEYVLPYQLLVYSVAVSTSALFIIVIFQKKLFLLKENNWHTLWMSALFGFINPFLFYQVLFKAYDLLPGQIAMALNFGWPVTLSVLSIPILKQKMTLKQLMAIVISFSGAVIIATKGTMFSLAGVSILGIILIIISTFIWAVFWLFNTRDKRDPVIKLFLGFCFGFLFTILINPLYGGINLAPAKVIPALVYVGLFEMGITFVIWMTALKLATNTARVSNLIFITPFLSLLVLNVVLGEQIYFSTFVGLFLIIIGIVFQAQTAKSKK
jgi:drug/metabolite transporter (DMT)-like permease